eukprot:GGOE01061161.1.p1 GENE.GGOE01061161.1~~GGOE01061161.1.p1  ORF type:complete len:198 (-),score=49.05 GGOE01061161.1:259-852(-)
MSAIDDNTSTQSEQTISLQYLRRFNIDGVVGNMLNDLLHEQPAQPVCRMMEWLQDFIEQEEDRLQQEKNQLDVEAQEIAVIDPTMASQLSREEHLQFLQRLGVQLKELPSLANGGKYSAIVDEAHKIDEQAMAHGYLRLRHFMAQIVDACEQCEALEASSRLPPPSLRFLRALLGAAVYHLTMLEIEVESLFDDAAD